MHVCMCRHAHTVADCRCTTAEPGGRAASEQFSLNRSMWLHNGCMLSAWTSRVCVEFGLAVLIWAFCVCMSHILNGKWAAMVYQHGPSVCVYIIDMGLLCMPITQQQRSCDLLNVHQQWCGRPMHQPYGPTSATWCER